jgi:hypothetical protein
MKFALLSALILVVTSTIVNAEEVFPNDCKALVITGELVQLPKTPSALVMLHNLSNTDLWITHPTKEGSANAGWSSRLQTGNWSALARSGAAFELSCIESRPGHEQQIPCASVLAVCQWSDAKMPPKSSGTFWAGENMSLSQLRAYVERRGFVVSEAKQTQ